MARHRLEKKRGIVAFIVSALSLSSMVAIGVTVANANGTPTYDLGGATLSFDKAKESIGGTLSVEGTQPDGDGSAVNFGVAFAVNDYINYYDVASIGGVDIDARLTFTAEVGMESFDGNNNGKIYIVDRPTSSAGENARIRSSLRFDAEVGDEYAAITIEFFTNLQDTPGGAEVAVNLQNVVMSVYDIDSYQYFEISDPDRYYFGDPTLLTATDAGSGRTRFAETAGTSSSSSNMNSRVSVEFDEIGTINLRLGQDVPAGSSESAAQFDLDFSAGASWGASVTFQENYSGGSSASQSEPGTANLTSNPFTRTGFSFAGWNTQADGSGTFYADGASYHFRESLTLYAQWTATGPVQSAPYSGPLPVKLVPNVVPSGTATSVTLEGERLSGITSAEVDGKPVTVVSAADKAVALVMPSLAEGTYNVKYFSNSGSIIHQDSLIVRGTALAVEEESIEGKSFYASKRFTNYRGDRGGVVSADEAAIAKFVEANPGITHVTCVGSTSGVPALETDRSLAMARATNACGIVEKLVPGVKVRYNASTGMGIGQWYRAVSMFVKGSN